MAAAVGMDHLRVAAAVMADPPAAGSLPVGMARPAGSLPVGMVRRPADSLPAVGMGRGPAATETPRRG